MHQRVAGGQQLSHFIPGAWIKNPWIDPGAKVGRAGPKLSVSSTDPAEGTESFPCCALVWGFFRNVWIFWVPEVKRGGMRLSVGLCTPWVRRES